MYFYVFYSLPYVYTYRQQRALLQHTATSANLDYDDTAPLLSLSSTDVFVRSVRESATTNDSMDSADLTAVGDDLIPFGTLVFVILMILSSTVGLAIRAWGLIASTV
jgi:hypothetical protein